MSHNTFRQLTSLAAAGLLAGLLAGAAVLAGASSPALAHDELVGTDLITSEHDGTVESVKLSFSNTIIEVGTEIIATASNGANIADGAPVVSGADVIQAFKKDLAVGTYSTSWRVVSSDGHPIEGSFGIQVKNDGSASVVDAALSEKDPRAAAKSNDQDAPTERNPLPLWATIAIGVGGTAALAAVVASLIIGLRRRSQAFGSSTDSAEADTHDAGSADPESAN